MYDYRVLVSRERLEDGSYVYNVQIVSADSAMTFPAVTEDDAEMLAHNIVKNLEAHTCASSIYYKWSE